MNFFSFKRDLEERFGVWVVYNFWPLLEPTTRPQDLVYPIATLRKKRNIIAYLKCSLKITRFGPGFDISAYYDAYLLHGVKKFLCY